MVFNSKKKKMDLSAEPLGGSLSNMLRAVLGKEARQLSRGGKTTCMGRGGIINIVSKTSQVIGSV